MDARPSQGYRQDKVSATNSYERLQAFAYYITAPSIVVSNAIGLISMAQRFQTNKRDTGATEKTFVNAFLISQVLYKSRQKRNLLTSPCGLPAQQ